MGSGQHKSTVVLDGKSDGLSKAAKAAEKSIIGLESSVDRLENQLRKATGAIDKQAAQIKKQEEAIKKLRGANKNSTESLKRYGQQIMGWIGTAKQAIEVIDQLATRQLNLNNVTANVPFSIDAAREATLGLVSDYDLMRQATIANRLGVAKTETDFANLAKTSTKLGVSIGQDATQSLEEFTNGLGRGSTEVLDNLGIILRAEEAHKLYAQSVNKTVAELTAIEKRQSVVNLGLERGAAAADKAKISTEGLGGAWALASIEAQNLLDKILQLDENLAEFSTETLKTFGANQEQAEKATDDAASALEVYGLSVMTLGASNAYFLIEAGIDSFSDANEELTQTIVRGRPAYNIFTDFLNQTGSAGERAGKVVDNLSRSFQESTRKAARISGDQDAKLQAELDDANATMRFDSGRKLMEKILEENAKQRKKDRANAREASEAMLEMQVAAAQRSTDITRRRVEEGKESTSELIDAIQAQAAIEQQLADMQFKHAGTAAERIRLVGGMEAAQHEADTAQAEARMAQIEGLEELSQRVADGQLVQLEQKREMALVEAEIHAAQAERDAEQIEDPLERMERERDIRLELLDVQIQAANDSGQALQLADQREGVLHDAKMSRLAEERAEREKTHKAITSITNRASALTIGAAQSVATAVLLEGKSLKESVKNTAASEGAKQAIVGAAELLRAAVAAASFNYPKAALHVGNAVGNFAFAAAMAATYGIAGGFSGGGSSGGKAVGGVGASSFGEGAAANGPGGSSSSSSSAGDSPDIPDSPAQQSASSSSGTEGSTGPTIIIQGNMIGVPERKFYAEVDRGLRDLKFAGGDSG